MEINYWWIGIVAVLAIVLIGWLIRRNAKDEADFKKEILQSEIKPEEGQENKDELL